MSHITTIDVEVKDLGALEKACAELGLIFERGRQTYRWYGTDHAGWDKTGTKGVCDHAIHVRSNAQAYGVGVCKAADGASYTLQLDTWGSNGAALEAKVGKGASRLRQEYAAQVAIAAAKKQGYRVTRKTLADGSLQLVATGALRTVGGR